MILFSFGLEEREVPLSCFKVSANRIVRGFTEKVESGRLLPGKSVQGLGRAHSPRPPDTAHKVLFVLVVILLFATAVVLISE